MNSFEFTLQLIDKIIWPVTTVGLIVLLRQPIKALIPFLSKAKISAMELEFNQELNRVQQMVPTDMRSMDWKVNLMTMAQQTPNTAVLESWKAIETRTEKLIQSVAPDTTLIPETRFKDMQHILAKGQWLTTKQVKIYDELRQIRNRVAHAEAYDVTTDQALSYLSIALPLIEHLDQKNEAEVTTT